MKLALVILACMAVVASTHHMKTDLKFADKEMLMKQKFFFEILRNMGQPLMLDEWMKHGEKLIIDESHYMMFDEYMSKFYESWKMGGLLPEDDFFSIVNKHHIEQAAGLFNFFYYAKDWETFVDNVVWARINVNQGMFVYALTLAVIHRKDMAGIMLPQIYEIMPEMFFNSKLVMKAENFDWEMFNKEIMFEKQWLSIYEKKHMKNLNRKMWLVKDWKMWQWWKLMGLEEDWHMEDKCMYREDMEMLKNNAMWTGMWKDMKMAWMPVDYTRDIEIMNEESKLSYFTEDLGWNSYWYYLNMDYSMMLDSKRFHLDKDRRGEWWLFNVQQILARYYMERLSHGMGEIESLSWHGPIDMGYDPEMMAYNGIAFTMRKNFWEIEYPHDMNMLNKIMSLESRINDAIAWGMYETKKNVSFDLWKPEQIEMIGNMLQGNMDLHDKEYFGYFMKMCCAFLSGQDYDAMTVMPSVFSNYETMLRDPLFYHLLKKVMEMLEGHKKMVPAYKKEDLLMPGINIMHVEVDKMMTFFDLVDFDVSNLMKDHKMYADGKMVMDKVLLARQMRLNHKPYTFEMKVMSDNAQKVVVRMFLAPYFDEFDQKINLMKHHENMLQLDEFTYDLKAGENMIKYSSSDSHWMVKDRSTYSEMYKMVMMALNGKEEFPLQMSQPHCGFPSRLMLPRGWAKGMPMKMFFVISPYKMDKEPELTYDPSYMCGIGSGTRHIDNLPFGWPFNRKIESMANFMMPNMFWKDVKIYHMDKFEKYYPGENKYENFGAFDYSFN